MARKLRRVEYASSEIHCYHVYSRVVDKTFHLENEAVKRWMVALLERFAQGFAVDVYGFAMMSNHFHLLFGWRPAEVLHWSDAEVVDRYEIIRPIRNQHNDLASNEEYRASVRQARLSNPQWLEKARTVLASPSEFMKDFKAKVTRRINRENDRVGTLWEGRFHCDPIHDDASMKHAMAYIDLNPFAAGIGEKPESCPFTSLYERVCALQQVRRHEAQQYKRWEQKCKQQQRHGSELTTGEQTAGEQIVRTEKIERAKTKINTWLRGYGEVGMLESYLNMVDRVARLVRKGKKQLADSTHAILDRLEQCMQEQINQADISMRDALEQQLATLRPTWARLARHEA